MAAIVTLGLLPFKLDTGEGVAVYSPQRVLRQMNYDQGVVSITGDSRSRSGRVADARFIGRGPETILEGHKRLLWPSAG